ncbi:MAG: hypothetical protein WDO56_35090 [Gammaproteobacteria bacterium]
MSESSDTTIVSFTDRKKSKLPLCDDSTLKRLSECYERLYLAKNLTALASGYAQKHAEEDIDLWNSLDGIAEMLEREADWLSSAVNVVTRHGEWPVEEPASAGD